MNYKHYKESRIIHLLPHNSARAVSCASSNSNHSVNNSHNIDRTAHVTKSGPTVYMSSIAKCESYISALYYSTI